MAPQSQLPSIALGHFSIVKSLYLSRTFPRVDTILYLIEQHSLPALVLHVSLFAGQFAASIFVIQVVSLTQEQQSFPHSMTNDVESGRNQETLEEAKDAIRDLAASFQFHLSGARNLRDTRHFEDVPPRDSYKPDPTHALLSKTLDHLLRHGLDRRRFNTTLPTEQELSHTSSASPRSSSSSTVIPPRRDGDIEKTPFKDEKHAHEIIGRTYLRELCKALMCFGAPTHGMEEYMYTSARAVGVRSEFLYNPGSMLCSYNEHVEDHSDVELVRQTQGLDLGKIRDVFTVYKCVIHAKYDPEAALEDLAEITRRPDRYRNWFRILIFGVASMAVGPCAFAASPIDFVPTFCLGCILGVLQLFVVPYSIQFSHVFEVFTAIVAGFLARAFGSIRRQGRSVFCFSALAQSMLALILPGYIVLNAALELQSRNMAFGSVRMVYAIIYTMFLEFGLFIGTAIFGLLYPDATTDLVCHAPAYWNPGNNSLKVIYIKFIWLPVACICLGIINQAKWRQMPVMTLLGVCGYQAGYWVSQHVSNNLQIPCMIASFVIGSLANLYSRFFHGLAAAAMLPAIFIQVPSGLAASGTLVAGLTAATQITGNTTGIGIVNNGTAGFLSAQNQGNRNGLGDGGVYSGTIFLVAYDMVQVAIGISMGLYLSALLVYPYGKRQSGLFAF